MYSFLWPHGLEPTRLLCPWDSPDKNTGVGCLCNPGDLPNSGIKPMSTMFPALAGGLFATEPPGKTHYAPSSKSSICSSVPSQGGLFWSSHDLMWYCFTQLHFLYRIYSTLHDRFTYLFGFPLSLPWEFNHYEGRDVFPILLNTVF